MSKRVLVTGGTGFIGHYIIKRLIQSGYAVSALVRKGSTHLNTLSVFDQHIQLFWGDINDVESLELACLDQDIVIHAAAIVAFNSAQSRDLIKVNVEGTANLVNVCLEQNINQLVHLSSIAALGGVPGQINLDESTLWIEKNTNLYAESKHQSELEVWRGSAEGLGVTILNPSLVIGPWDTSHHSMQLFKAALNNLPFYPSGSNGFVDVRDVAEAVLLSLEKKVTLERIIINGYNLSYREMLVKIASLMGKNPPTWLFPKSLARFGAWVIRLVAFLLGRKHYFQASIIKSIYTPSTYNNKKSVELLGLQYRPLDQTLNEVITRYAEFDK
ncbi:MAG: SDR family NAD(P)-dependent oxidoreductase [Saprospiraceae bacterium]|nr:SDR family NAD(P)-dependent oxidoreductase [Saprospiraceae bacterium]